MKRFIMHAVLLIAACSTAFGWGSTGHKLINKQAVLHLPASMKLFIDQKAYFETHSVDADVYKNTKDTAMFSEQYRHYLDIDDYPDFHHLTRSFDTLVATYGWLRVRENGTNPWAVVWVMDSLTAQLHRGDWNTAYLTAAYLGHYVADAHQPLHATYNYNGQSSGNTGIHSRYESSMINTFQGQIAVTKDSVHYIEDVYGFVFNTLLHSNGLNDSIFHADNAGKAASGGSYTTVYYDTLWKRLGTMTIAQFQSATIDLASLWYTAWVNAGLLEKPTGVSAEWLSHPTSFLLLTNYPNPFNPSTTISFQLPAPADVSLVVYDITGKLVDRLVEGRLDAGTHTLRWDAGSRANGVYLCRLQAGTETETKRMVLVK